MSVCVEWDINSTHSLTSYVSATGCLEHQKEHFNTLS